MIQNHNLNKNINKTKVDSNENNIIKSKSTSIYVHKPGTNLHSI